MAQGGHMGVVTGGGSPGHPPTTPRTPPGPPDRGVSGDALDGDSLERTKESVFGARWLVHLAVSKQRMYHEILVRSLISE